MSDTTHNLAKAGVDQVIDIADKSADAAIEAVDQLSGLVEDLAGSAVTFTGNVRKDAIAEIRHLHKQFVERTRAVLDKVAEPLKVLP